MYRNLALINGVLLAVMVFYNGMLSGVTGPYMSTLIYHVLGLILIVIISLAKKNKLSNFKKIPFVFFLPGILSVITILLNNICIPEIGITLTVGISLYGQLVMSALVEHFGLFGMPVNRFRREKLLGFSVISLGVILMVTI